MYSTSSTAHSEVASGRVLNLEIQLFYCQISESKDANNRLCRDKFANEVSLPEMDNSKQSMIGAHFPSKPLRDSEVTSRIPAATSSLHPIR
jgi:hypothetical protein